MSKLKAFSYFGGKYKILEEIYQYLPPKTDIKHFVDVFGGSMTVALNLPYAKIPVTACDINQDIINFFTVLRDNRDKLIESLLLTPCSEAEYKAAWEGMQYGSTAVERARCFYVRAQMGFYGLAMQRTKRGKSIGFQASTKTFNCTGRADIVSRWDNCIERLFNIAIAIRNKVQIVSSSYEKTISRFDQSEAFFYVDPPYNPASRSATGEYKHDFTEKDHRDLAKILNLIKGRAMVSGYNGSLMNELYTKRGWTATKLKNQKFSNLTRKELAEEKQEWIWTNYPIIKTKSNKQLKFFNQQ
ncbi:MAG: DNA adenine methylase [Aureispira sp.]